MGATKKRDVVAIEARQDALTGLPAELALIIEEIGGALNEIIATLGLSMSFPVSFLTSLTYSCSLLTCKQLLHYPSSARSSPRSAL